MAKAKTTKKGHGEGESLGKDLQGAVEPPKWTVLTAADRRFLLRVTHLLMAIQNPDLAQKAARQGYTAEEHAAAWAMHAAASGSKRSLDHCLAEHSLAPPVNDADRLRLLREVDDEENKWLPRTRAIIRRIVPAAEREAFLGAFFKDLAQQPLGPGVIGSMSTFIERVKGLPQSKLPHAGDVRQVLSDRGFTDAKMAEIGKKLDVLKASFEQASVQPRPTVSSVDVALGQAAQREALSALRDWFNDWATTFRTELGAGDLRRLGLSPHKAAGVDEDADDPEAQGDQGAVDGEDGQ